MPASADADPGPGPGPDALPPAAWARVLALAAQVLPSVATPPATLRKVATFTPARRLRHGGSQIAAALATEDFRERVGTLVAANLPNVADAVRGAVGADHVDLLDLAAVGWLLRPDGWEQVVGHAVRQLEERQDAESVVRGQAELVQLRARVADAEASARDLRARHRETTGALKAENAELRRKLGEARAGERAARASAQAAQDALRQVESGTSAAVAAAETEARRLRSRLTELTEALSGARRSAKGGRDESAIRARLLLDVLIEAGQGLRRELALPPAEGAPSDRLEADLAEASVRTWSAAGALGPGSPALLEQYLTLPRTRLIVDGYNVTKLARPTTPLESQRAWLLTGLAALVARTGTDTIVVFDAADSESRPPVSPPRGVKVTFSPQGVIADDVIRDLVAVEPSGRVVVVVTSDRAVGDDVRRSGARVATAPALVGLLSR